MASIFSLDNKNLFLEIVTDSPLTLRRRVVSVETLEGTESRDLGISPGDSVFTHETFLSDMELNSLLTAIETGERLGLSLSNRNYSILIKSAETKRKNFDLNSVKIEAAVAGEFV